MNLHQILFAELIFLCGHDENVAEGFGDQTMAQKSYKSYKFKADDHQRLPTIKDLADTNLCLKRDFF